MKKINIDIDNCMLLKISILLVILGFVSFMLPTYEDIKFVYAEILLTLGCGLLAFLKGSKLKEKMSFQNICISFIIIFVLLSILKLLVYNMKNEIINILISVALSIAYSIWFSNITLEEDCSKTNKTSIH